MQTPLKKNYKKIAFALSLCALILWAAMGTGASLAWFQDTSPEIRNVFHFASFDVKVSHQLTDGTWEEVDGQTKLFDDSALYEPGYVQVVYLKVENKGSVPFDFSTAVSVTGYSVATNFFGQTFNLQDHLKFGLAAADLESEMKELVSTREKAEAIANMPLQSYSTQKANLGAGESAYLALVVRMPKEVGNVANYRGDDVPTVELGVIVKADQKGS